MQAKRYLAIMDDSKRMVELLREILWEQRAPREEMTKQGKQIEELAAQRVDLSTFRHNTCKAFRHVINGLQHMNKTLDDYIYLSNNRVPLVFDLRRRVENLESQRPIA